MKPLKLTLQGIYSYRDKYVVDFEELTEAGLFGIFGPTGSGKSTILEAISFALYGKTERLGERDRNYNMMNLRSKEMFIEIEFVAGLDNKKYRFSVTAKRKKDKTVESPKRKGAEWIGNKWVPLENDTAEGILNLSYENFRRTIIIPQNKFSEFLHLTDSNRNKMLEELFHLDKFDLWDNAAFLEKENDEKKTLIEGQLLALGDMSENQLLVQQQLEKELDFNLGEKGKYLGFLEMKINELRTLSDFFSKKQDAKNQLVDLYKQLPNIQQKEKQLAEYELCQKEFRDLLETIHSAEKQLQLSQAQFQQNKKELQQTDSELGAVEKDFVKIQTDYKNREKLIQQQKELQNILIIKQKESEQKELAARIEKGTEFIEKTKSQLDSISKEIENTTLQIANLKSQITNEAELHKVSGWFKTQENHQKQIQNQEQQHLISQNRINDINKDILALLKNKCDIVVNQSTISLTEAKEFLFNKIQSIENQQKEIENTLLLLSGKQQITHLAQSLKNNEPCPLCGSLHHPQPLQPQNITFQLQQTQAQKTTLLEQQNKLLKLQNELSAMEGSYQTYIRSQTQNHQLIQQEKDKLEKHLLTFSWSNYNPNQPNLVAERVQQNENIKKQIEILDNQLKINQEKEKTLQKDKDKFTDGLNKYQNNLTKINSEIQTLQSQFQHINNETTQLTEIEIADKIKYLINQHSNIENSYNTLDNQLKTIQNKKNELSGIIKNQENTLLQAQQNLDNLQNELNIRLINNNLQTKESVVSILNKPLNISEEKNSIQQFYSKLQLLQNQLNDYKTNIGEKTFDPAELAKFQTQLPQTKTELENIQRQIGSIQNNIKEIKNKLIQKQTLDNQNIQLQLRAENIKTLKALFREKAFVNYVASEELNTICFNANQRFTKLSRQRMQLQLDINNNIEIIDFMNDEQKRSVKTLSGGETFQASLALALALTDSIHNQNQSHQNFFFLDEGFGTLDNESLRIVSEALKSLRKENRIVGVISHNETMQKEIPIHLQLKNTAENGSHIAESWNVQNE